MPSGRTWLQPSLTGRVVGTLVLALVLVTIVLVTREFLNFRESLRTMQELQSATKRVLRSLPDDEAVALQVLRATEQQYNDSRQQEVPRVGPVNDLLFELADAGSGQIRYASQSLRTLTLPAQLVSPMRLSLLGRSYGFAQAQNARWRLRILDPSLSDEAALTFYAKDIGTSILIALPFVLIPLWLAVRRGLAPLRALVQHVRRRDAGDFSPIALDLRYAELKPLVESFNALFKQSRDALARERALVQDAAHELRTPLAVIATQAHALVSSKTESAQHEALGRLESAIARASHQVHQVLTLARMEGHALRALVSVDCVEMARSALIDVEPRARALGVDLSLDAPDRLTASLDRVAFHSVLDNLISNALSHAQGATRIQISISGVQSQLMLSVADDGCGITEEDRARVFERFHRGRHVTAAGSGLGLSIVREAARVMGGDIRIGGGIEDRGVAFELRIPWRQDSQSC